MSKDVGVWITARDGSVHATLPPITAAGQSMLCGRFYGRQDLRIEAQGTVGHAPAHACRSCLSLVPASGADRDPLVRERKAPMWP